MLNIIEMFSTIISSLITLTVLWITIIHNRLTNNATLNYNRRIQEINSIKEKAAPFINDSEIGVDFLLGRLGNILLGREDIELLHKDLKDFYQNCNYSYTHFYFALPIRFDSDDEEISYVKYISEKWEILGNLISDAYKLLEVYLNDNIEFNSAINGWINSDRSEFHSDTVIKVITRKVTKDGLHSLNREDKDFRDILCYTLSHEQHHFQMAEKTKRFIDYEYKKANSLYAEEASITHAIMDSSIVYIARSTIKKWSRHISDRKSK